MGLLDVFQVLGSQNGESHINKISETISKGIDAVDSGLNATTENIADKINVTSDAVDSIHKRIEGD